MSTASAHARVFVCELGQRTALDFFLNPNHGPAASHYKRILMKTTFLTCLCSIALALSVLGQTPTAPPTSPSASVTPALSPSATAADDDSIERSVSRKLKHRFGVTL